jgi:chromosome segregation ATPase
MSDWDEQTTDPRQQRSRASRETRGDYADERDRRAREIAFEEGRHRERIEGRLNSHEQRLNAINGSIDRAAEATEALEETVRALHAQIEMLVNEQRTRDELEKFRAAERKLADEKRTEQVRLANQQQISRRDFMLGVAILTVMILGLIATVLTSTHLL